MTKVTLSTPDSRNAVMVEDDQSIKEILDDNGINYSRASVMIDGMTLTADQLRKTLSDLGTVGDCIIATCVKMDNA